MKNFFKKFICNLFGHYDHKLNKTCVCVIKECLPLSGKMASIPGRRNLNSGRENPETYRSLSAYALCNTEIKCTRCGESVSITPIEIQALSVKELLPKFKKSVQLLCKTNNSEKKTIESALKMYEVRAKAAQ